MTLPGSDKQPFAEGKIESSARPVFLQGVFPFLGQGLAHPDALSTELNYTVPEGCAAVLMYFRAGNACDQLIYLCVVGDGKPRRYFPIGPQHDSHVELAIREPIPAGTKLEIHLAAAENVYGTAIIDIGFLEWQVFPEHLNTL
jgi:assimilatory nitrate reductase catalytic subunit